MHILVLRFSAMGDVALTAPVFKMLLDENPELEISIVSKPFFKSFFTFSDRIHFIEPDFKGKYKGLLGLKRLASELHQQAKFDLVVDLHDVLRSKIIRTFLKLKGHQVNIFDKGRSEKKKALKEKSNVRLTHTTERYINAFKPLKVTDLNQSHCINTLASNEIETFIQSLPSDKSIIGIAPFAAHSSKEWGLDKIERLIEQLSEHAILLFGGGKKESQELKALENKFDHAISVAGQFSLDQELNLISKLQLMVAMDSSNMHLAAIVNIPVVSIWGPTHQNLGFGPLFNNQHIVEISQDELPCRPVSIYGKLKTDSDNKCAEESMNRISVEMVLHKINSLIA